MELINCQGKTPEATMASALYTDVKRKLHLSVFTRPQVHSTISCMVHLHKEQAVQNRAPSVSWHPCTGPICAKPVYTVLVIIFKPCRHGDIGVVGCKTYTLTMLAALSGMPSHAAWQMQQTLIQRLVVSRRACLGCVSGRMRASRPKPRMWMTLAMTLP